MTDNKIKSISVQELKALRDKNPDTCIIDVRELHEWHAIHIPDVLHIPNDQITSCIKEKVSDVNQPIYLHCRSGARSLFAAHCLMELGYKEVYNVDGGIIEWAMAGFPVVE